MKKLFVVLGALCALDAFAWNAQDEYQRLVSQSRYPEALAYVCELYGLDCHNVRFKKKSYPGARAITDSFNHVWVYPGAFTFDRTGAAHAGWLGAVVGHELVHTKQSLARRSLSSLKIKLFGNHTIEAENEIEGWKYMLDNRRKFDLSCFMVLEIEEQLHYYRTILERKGRAPKDDDDEARHYQLSTASSLQILDRCKKEKAGG